MLIEVPFAGDWTELEITDSPERKAADSDQRISSKIFMSPPRVLKVAPDRDGLGADLYEFMRQERQRYELRMVALACSFLSADDPLLKAVLVISLERDDGVMEDRPQAWNLQPQRLAKPATKLQKSFSLEMSFNPKARVDFSEQISPDEDEYIVLAHGEGGSCPEWIFQRTSKHDFDGIHYLGMSVMVPRHVPASAHLALSAKSSQRRLGVIRRPVRIPEQLRTIALSCLEADQQPVRAVATGHSRVGGLDLCPVIPAGALGAGADRNPLPGPAGSRRASSIAGCGPIAVVTGLRPGHRQDVAQPAAGQLDAQPRILAVHLMAATRAAGAPAFSARVIIALASAGWWRIPCPRGTPAS